MLLKNNDKLWLPFGDHQLMINPSTGAWLYLSEECKNIVSVIEKSNSIEEVFNSFPNISPFSIIELLKALNENNTRIKESINLNCKCSCDNSMPNFASVKIAKNCNLKCSYCYIDADPNKKNKMDEETAIKIVDELLMMHKKDDTNFSFCFHGGEPLLNLNVIKKVTEYVKPYRDKISLSIQTNGTLITDEIATFLKDNNIFVGISLDGTEELHNISRYYANGKGSFENVMKGIKVLNDNDISFGIISVINRENAKKMNEMLDFFIENKIYSLSFSPLRKYGRGKDDIDLFLDDETLFNAYTILLEKIILHNKTHNKSEWLHERVLTTIVKQIYFNQRHFMCMQSPCGAGRRMLGFDYNGDVYICDNFIGDEDFKIGSVYDGNLKDMLFNSEVRKKALSRQKENLVRCKDCVWRGLCGGLCYASDYYSGARGVEETEVCLFYKKIIPYIIQKIAENPDLPYLIDPDIKKEPFRNIYISLDSDDENIIDIELFKNLLSIHNITSETSIVYLHLKNFEKNLELNKIISLLKKYDILHYIVTNDLKILSSEEYDKVCNCKSLIFNANKNFDWLKSFVEIRKNKHIKIPFFISLPVNLKQLEENINSIKSLIIPEDKIYFYLPDETEKSYELLNNILEKMTNYKISNNIILSNISEKNLFNKNYIYLLNQNEKDYKYLWIDMDNLLGKNSDGIPI